jgi:hypothetical protein
VFVTNHVLAGATIGALLGRHPAGAFAAGFVSHFAMDACPHWGTNSREPAAQARFLHAARCDGCAGLAAMAAGAALVGRGGRPAVLSAMIGAALPDLDKPCLHFFGFDPFPNWFRWIHKSIQRESPHLLRRELRVGAVLALVAAVTLGQRRRAPIRAG